MSEETQKINPQSKTKVPDAITQTDNSAKRAQNSQMRQKKTAIDEPEALRKMREEREACELKTLESAGRNAQNSTRHSIL